MIYGERSYSKPVIVDQEDRISTDIEKVPLNQKLINENWLQELIRKQPNIIPVEDIEPVFAPLISIGREISTSAGLIDNLFISPDGYLTLVETKLWRNPEARREVVGQIIDYAKDMSKWTFNELDKKVKEYNKLYEKCDYGIIDTIRERGGFEIYDESKLVDLIYSNLKKGRFLLLIIGDGIHQSVEEMVEFLNQTPNMLFSLALIELQLYKFTKSNEYLVIPQIVTRTREITRAVVRVEGASIDRLQINVETANDDNIAKKKKRITLSQQDFYNELMNYIDSSYVNFTQELLARFEELGCITQWRQSSVMVRYIDPDISNQKFTFFGIDKYGNVFVGWLPDQLSKVGFDKGIAEEFYLRLDNLFKGKISSYTAKVQDICDNMNEFMYLIEDLIFRINEEYRALNDQ